MVSGFHQLSFSDSSTGDLTDGQSTEVRFNDIALEDVALEGFDWSIVRALLVDAQVGSWHRGARGRL